ncbi:MAG: hypothetical protein HZA78_06375 [Candidatus Schekmanbacteria bacterium]|nr:hypothetical protein [Candidatus Schekmanbacteria bacterium]
MPTLRDRKEVNKYIHELHLVPDFHGRQENFNLLNNWAEEQKAKVIIINGIGGQGKSTLVGHWLKEQRTPHLAKIPVFYWSFYENPDLSEFDWELLDFAQRLIPLAERRKGVIQFPLIKAAQGKPLILVLDGLERLQRKTDSSLNRRVLEPGMQFFLNMWMRYQHQGLMVITSRFNLSQLTQCNGVFNLHLSSLSPSEGASLLSGLNVLGSDKLLAEYSARFHGHPLTLKIMAGIVSQYCNGNLAEFAAKQIISRDTHEKLAQSLGDLLHFYVQQFHQGQHELLGIISLFRRPLEIGALLGLIRGMESISNTSLANLDEETILKEVQELAADYLIEIIGGDKVICHPLIQSYFRHEFHLRGCRKEVAGFLQRGLRGERPRDIEEVRDLVNAVQLLCDEDDYPAAHQLCRTRLVEGGYGLDVFKHLPAIPEGLQCCLAFVGDDERQKKTEVLLGKGAAAVYLTSISLYNMKLGNISLAREWCSKGLDLCRTLQNERTYPLPLHEINDLEQALGNIRQAQKLINQDEEAD